MTSLRESIRSPDRPVALNWFVAGFSLWLMSFVALYGLHALGCTWGWHMVMFGPVGALRVVLAGVFVLHLIVLGAVLLLARELRRRSPDISTGHFVRAAALALSAAAFVATLWTGFPALVLPLCV